MPKKKKKSKVKKRSSKKRRGKIIRKSPKKRKVIRKKTKPRKKIVKKTDNTTSELIFKTKPEWIKISLANKAQYQKKYNESIKNNNAFWKK